LKKNKSKDNNNNFKMSDAIRININNTPYYNQKIIYTKPLEGQRFSISFKLEDVIISIWKPLFDYLNEPSDRTKIPLLIIDVIMALINVNKLLAQSHYEQHNITDRFGIYDVSIIINSALEAQLNNWDTTIKLFNELINSPIYVQLNLIELWMIIYQNIV
jgi:hypothetical protein